MTFICLPKLYNVGGRIIMKGKTILMIALVAVGAVALVTRIPQARALVFGN